jgi:xanthine dehydrogenase molybdopterin-binding subunit B
VGKGGDDPVGMPMMHVAAEKQVTGEAQYIDDIPQCGGVNNFTD